MNLLEGGLIWCLLAREKRDRACIVTGLPTYAATITAQGLCQHVKLENRQLGKG